MSLCLIDVHGDIEGDFEWAEELPRITNGDVIKALFPNYSTDLLGINDVSLIDKETGTIIMIVHKCWWNAPYKKNKKGVLESIAEEQKTLLDTTKAWSKALEHGYVN